MKRMLLSLIASLLLLVPCFAASPAIAKAHKASFHIAQSTITGNNICSATSIGPQALLTAAHCELPDESVEIVGESVQTVATIVDRIHDGNDHTILLLKNVTFPVFVDVLEKKPSASDDVFSFGNPGDWTDVFQRGYVAGIQYEHSKPPLVLLALQAYPGSSGSGVFNSDGALILVVSFADVQADKDTGLSVVFAAAYPTRFSDDELNRARTFTCAADPAEKK